MKQRHQDYVAKINKITLAKCSEFFGESIILPTRVHDKEKKSSFL